jgi:ribonuclease HI
MPQTSAPRFTDTPDTAAQTSWVTAHCDGGARGNPGPAGYGAVLQDETGKVLAELSEFLGVRTNNYAEYSGLLGCLQWALDGGWQRLRVVSDSELMVKQIQGKYKVNSPDLRPLWEEARRRIAKLERFEISHALRHKNKAADQLANDAMDRGMDRGTKRGNAAEPVHAGGAGGAPIRVAPHTSADPGKTAAPAPIQPRAATEMLRGFTKDGSVHLLGGAKLPDGIFVKVIPE